MRFKVCTSQPHTCMQAWSGVTISLHLEELRHKDDQNIIFSTAVTLTIDQLPMTLRSYQLGTLPLPMCAPNLRTINVPLSCQDHTIYMAETKWQTVVRLTWNNNIPYPTDMGDMTIRYCRGRRNGHLIVRNAILALSDKWLSLDTHPMDEQIIIAQMSFINLGQVHIWFQKSADVMLLVRRMSASQISREPLTLLDFFVYKIKLQQVQIEWLHFETTPTVSPMNKFKKYCSSYTITNIWDNHRTFSQVNQRRFVLMGLPMGQINENHWLIH